MLYSQLSNIRPTDSAMRCACESVFELYGNEADEYRAST